VATSAFDLSRPAKASRVSMKRKPGSPESRAKSYGRNVTSRRISALVKRPQPQQSVCAYATGGRSKREGDPSAPLNLDHRALFTIAPMTAAQQWTRLHKLVTNPVHKN
jgi:hypothetical protein